MQNISLDLTGRFLERYRFDGEQLYLVPALLSHIRTFSSCRVKVHGSLGKRRSNWNGHLCKPQRRAPFR